MTKQEKATKECPYCWEEILETAKKSKHCWEFLDDELRAENKHSSWSTTIDYSWCWLIKRWMFQWAPKIQCPKCWFEWTAKEQRWSYSWCVFFLLLCLWIIPWILYYLFARDSKYVCPQCWEDHLKKTWSTTDWVFLFFIIIIWLWLFMWIISSISWTNNHVEVREETPTISQIVNNRINYVYENFWPNGIEKRDEFESMECVWDCSVADVELKLNANPKDLDVDTIARWQTLNLAKALKQDRGMNTEAYCTVYVKGVKKEKCKWFGDTLDFSFWNNGCETY